MKENVKTPIIIKVFIFTYKHERLRAVKVAQNLKTSHLIGLEKHKLIVIFFLTG